MKKKSKNRRFKASTNKPQQKEFVQNRLIPYLCFSSVADFVFHLILCWSLMSYDTHFYAITSSLLTLTFAIPVIFRKQTEFHRVFFTYELIELSLCTLFLCALDNSVHFLFIIPIPIILFYSFCWFQYKNNRIFQRRVFFIVFFTASAVCFLFSLIISHQMPYSGYSRIPGLSILAIIFFFVRLVGACYFLAIIGRTLKYLSEETTEVTKDLFLSLIKTIEKKDSYTEGHSRRVAKYASMIAQRAGLKESQIALVYQGALYHDIGKIAVPDRILNKKSKSGFLQEELDTMRNHTIEGADILSEIKNFEELAIIAKYHHERWDGSGYPEGKAGKKINNYARIVAVADSYDAMTSHRIYHHGKPRTQAEVREEIEKGMGSQFDPEFAAIMLDIIDEDKKFKLKGY